MDELLEFSERPTCQEAYMIAGWRQWADAGAISSGLPVYLAEQLGARKIGSIQSDRFYMYQLPGTQDFLRPEVKMKDGYRVEFKPKKNEVFFSGDEQKGVYIFTGDEPHLGIERYAEAFFNLAKELGVRRVAAVGGVYAPVPFDKDREFSCSYSLPKMKDELSPYAVRFSNYEGGASIGTYLVDQAEKMSIEYVAIYAMVPMYDLSQLAQHLQVMTIDNDHKAWLDLLRRFDYMFKMGLDLTVLEQQSEESIESITDKITELEKKMPQLQVKDHIKKLTKDFAESSFMPLDDVWETGLRDIFKDLDP
jgi:proteasome assembly chaperone (PAC2) family protein